MQQHQRNRHDQAQHGSHQGLRDAVGHQLRIARAEQRQRLKGLNHAGHGTQQAQQRADGREDFQRRQAALDCRCFLEHGFIHAQLQGFHIDIRVLVVDRQNPAQRVVLVGSGRVLLLAAHLRAQSRECDETEDGDQQADQCQTDDDVTHGAALVDTLARAGRLHEYLQQLAARGVDRHPYRP